MKKAIYILWLICSAGQIGAQNLNIHITDSVKTGLREEIYANEGSYRDSVELQNRINNVKILLFTQGYLLSASTIQLYDSTIILTVSAGPQFYSNTIDLILPEGLVIPEIEKYRQPTGTLDSAKLKRIINYYLSFLENHGYPFAGIQFENYSFQNDTLKGSLSIKPGPLITLDSVVIKGFDRFSKNVLKYDLKYSKGMIYDESYLHSLPELTAQIEYLNMTRPPAVAFTKSKTILYLYMEEVKGNQIDGVIGLNTDENGEVSLNGELQLRLLHIFKRGEEFNIRWRRPDESVQTLNFNMEFPYILNTPVWMEGSLSIFKQDSSFVNSGVQGLIKYLLESGNFLSGGINYRSSNVLINTGSESSPDAFSSFNTTFFKLGFELSNTNRIFVPTKGYRLTVYGMTGKRKSAEQDQDQFGWELYGEKWWAINPRHIIKTDLRTEALFGQDLFTNELFRIGGLNTLRGFNEQSIYASKYGIGTLEYRYMIGTYDYLALFGDVAYVENSNLSEFTTTVFTGLGAGISFQTNAGIFSLFYAVGKDDRNPFDLRTSKIHFGYVNRF